MINNKDYQVRNVFNILCLAALQFLFLDLDDTRWPVMRQQTATSKPKGKTYKKRLMKSRMRAGQRSILLTFGLTWGGSAKGQKPREESISACLSAACHLLILLHSPGANASGFCNGREWKEGRGRGKKFSNLSCYKTEKKRPQLCLLKKPFLRSLEKLWKSSR